MLVYVYSVSLYAKPVSNCNSHVIHYWRVLHNILVLSTFIYNVAQLLRCVKTGHT